MEWREKSGTYVRCPESGSVESEEFVSVGGFGHLRQEGPGPDLDAIVTVAQSLEEYSLLGSPVLRHSLALFNRGLNFFPLLFNPVATHRLGDRVDDRHLVGLDQSVRILRPFPGDVHIRGSVDYLGRNGVVVHQVCLP